MPFALWVSVALLLTLGVIKVLGQWRWNALTQRLWSRLEPTRRQPPTPDPPNVPTDTELHRLPQPVQRYLRLALGPEAQRLASVDIETAGSFDTGDSTPAWKRFTARQRAVLDPPGFAWSAIVSLIPGIAIRVHDAYIDGEGIMRPSILGLLDVDHLQGEGELAEGELMRFLAESAWYPTMLLPGQGVDWTPIDEHSALATLRHRDLAVALTFHFAEDGMIASVRAAARARTVGGRMIPTPWEGRWWNYESVNGMSIPTEGEVAWELPTGRKPYWRGHLTSIKYYSGSSVPTQPS
jgi:hypothetical protein